MECVTVVFGKLTLMGHFGDMNKSVNGMITSDGILGNSFAAPRLAKPGINDNMTGVFALNFRRMVEVIEGWHIGNFNKWDDQYVAGVFQSDVLKYVNNTVITPGIGDTPLWASTPLGKKYFSSNPLRPPRITVPLWVVCRKARHVLLWHRLSDRPGRTDLRA